MKSSISIKKLPIVAILLIYPGIPFPNNASQKALLNELQFFLEIWYEFPGKAYLKSSSILVIYLQFFIVLPSKIAYLNPGELVLGVTSTTPVWVPLCPANVY